MKGFTEFKTRIESDKAFAAKFVNTENEAQLIALAKAEGYDLEQLNEDELNNVSGGSAVGDKIKQFWDWITS
ncbi:MAG: Nif11-like leader peptide family natural product precursor [Selenomonadaceae bacterium]|nr:Nif11-like leader peptide family natural product precursor [Selenomonadaceae bacterium]